MSLGGVKFQITNPACVFLSFGNETGNTFMGFGIRIGAGIDQKKISTLAADDKTFLAIKQEKISLVFRRGGCSENITTRQYIFFQRHSNIVCRAGFPEKDITKPNNSNSLI